MHRNTTKSNAILQEEFSHNKYFLLRKLIISTRSNRTVALNTASTHALQAMRT